MYNTSNPMSNVTDYSKEYKCKECNHNKFQYVGGISRDHVYYIIGICNNCRKVEIYSDSAWLALFSQWNSGDSNNGVK